MKKVFFLTTVFAVVVSILLLSSCSHASSGGGGKFYDSSSYVNMNFDTEEPIGENDNYAGKLETYDYEASSVEEAISYFNRLESSSTQVSVRIKFTKDAADRDSLVNAINNVPEGKTVYLDIHCTYINASDAFKGCASLSGLVLAAHHEKIGEKDFNNCKNLEKVYFSDRVTSVEKNPFYGCDKLTEIGVDTSSTYFSTDTNGVLYSSDKTRLVLYPTGKEGDYTLDDSTTTIGSYAFYGTKVKKVILNESLAVIEPNAFSESNATEVVFKTKEGGWVVSKDKVSDPSLYYNLHEVSTENAIDLLKGDCVAMYWYATGKETIVNDNKVIEHYFKGNVAEAVDYINSLSNVSGTTNYVYFVAIVDSSETSTTNLRKVLRGLSATENTGPYVSLDLTEATALDLSVSEAFGDSSSTTKYYALREVKLPESCTEIGQYAFYYQAGLQNVVLPASLTSIGSSAFRECSSLKTINLSGCTALKSIGSSAFRECSSLKTINLSGCTKLESIGTYTFYSCSSLTTVDLPKCTALQSIGNNAFYNCSSLATVDMSQCTALQSIGNNAFDKCSSLKTVDLSQCTKLESIGDYAFDKCSSLKTVDLSKCTALESIGGSAFGYCSSLTDLGNDNKLPASLTSIGGGAFEKCSALTEVDMSGCTELESIGGYAFYECSALTEVDMSGCTELESIGKYAFYSCSSLTEVNLSGCTALQSIGNNAFYSCSSLTKIKIEKTGDMAWGYSSSIKSNPAQSNLTMVTDFEEAPMYYLTGNSVNGETPQTTLSDGYKYYWYKVEYAEDNP